MKQFLLIGILVAFVGRVTAQDTLVREAPRQKLHWLDISPEYNPKRAAMYGTAVVGVYGGVLTGLYALWYKNFPRSGFHFFNDNIGWLQVDKIGHTYATYNVTKWSIDYARWTGMKENKAIIYGAGSGWIYLTIIEVLDAFSLQWGASPGDLIANTTGTLLVAGQEYFWKDQLIRMKFSWHPVHYTPEVRDRAEHLYGTSIPERIMKDYNGQTNWSSINLKALFGNQDKIPPWLMVSLGYSAEGLLGAESNIIRKDGKIVHDFSHYPRYRQYLLSLDLDLTKIPTRHRGLKFAFGILNVLKIPAPALEFNSLGKLRGYPVYY